MLRNVNSSLFHKHVILHCCSLPNLVSCTIPLKEATAPTFAHTLVLDISKVAIQGVLCRCKSKSHEGRSAPQRLYKPHDLKPMSLSMPDKSTKRVLTSLRARSSRSATLCNLPTTTMTTTLRSTLRSPTRQYTACQTLWPVAFTAENRQSNHDKIHKED